MMATGTAVCVTNANYNCDFETNIIPIEEIISVNDDYRRNNIKIVNSFSNSFTQCSSSQEYESRLVSHKASQGIIVQYTNNDSTSHFDTKNDNSSGNDNSTNKNNDSNTNNDSNPSNVNNSSNNNGNNSNNGDNGSNGNNSNNGNSDNNDNNNGNNDTNSSSNGNEENSNINSTNNVNNEEIQNEDDENMVKNILTNEILDMPDADMQTRTFLIKCEIGVLKSEANRLAHAINTMTEKHHDNEEKIKLNRQLPHLVSNVLEIIDYSPETEEDTSGNYEENIEGRKSMVIKTSTRQSIYLPVIGLVDPAELKPGDYIGVNKDSYLVLDKLPPEYDNRVTSMELDEKPQDEYSDIGGLDKEIQELVEAIVLPMTHKDRFDKIGIKPPKGVLLYGPPGTGKTLMARACAAQTNATFLKLAGPQLVQMFIGDGAKMVRDAFALAREKSPTIIFIDEIDAIGTKRFDSELSGDREIQRTMLELLNQLDGFSSDDKVKVIGATNRPDTLDPALLRSGRLDRKIELPHPDEESRARILQIHCRKMNVNKNDVNFQELSRSTDDFNGAQLKAVCVEAGMVALRRNGFELQHEDFIEGISAVQAKKKSTLNYFT